MQNVLTDSIAERMRDVRLELFGEHGAPLLAAEIGVPTRMLLGYEGGRAIDAMTMLRFLVATRVEAGWLLRGEGRKYGR